MSRKALSFIVGGLGVVLAFATLLGFSLMGSLLADARTEHLAGPGVDVFLRTPFPVPGSEIVLDVEARGGSKAGLLRAVVREGSRELAEKKGRGATWGYSIVEGKERGAADETLSFPARDGESMHLTVEVSYVLAMSSGSTFTNQTYSDQVPLEVRLYSESGRNLGRLWLAARAIGLLVLWMALVWGVTYLFATVQGPGDGEMEGIGLLMGLMGGGMAGYWLFARTLMAVLETTSTVWAVVLTALWIVLPLWRAWRWSKRRAAFKRYRLRSADGRAVTIDVRDLPGERRGKRLSVRRDQAQLRVRWSEERLPIDQLVIEATELRLPLELAHHAAARVGPLVLEPPSGPTLLVEATRTIDDIERDYSAAMLAETQRLLEAIAKIQAARRS